MIAVFKYLKDLLWKIEHPCCEWKLTDDMNV
jgi:hypothetical protein